LPVEHSCVAAQIWKSGATQAVPHANVKPNADASNAEGSNVEASNAEGSKPAGTRTEPQQTPSPMAPQAALVTQEIWKGRSQEPMSVHVPRSPEKQHV
jgi:hypothetical protein